VLPKVVLINVGRAVTQDIEKARELCKRAPDKIAHWQKIRKIELSETKKPVLNIANEQNS
jgi:hypothetical protein